MNGETGGYSPEDDLITHEAPTEEKPAHNSHNKLGLVLGLGAALSTGGMAANEAPTEPQQPTAISQSAESQANKEDEARARYEGGQLTNMMAKLTIDFDNPYSKKAVAWNADMTKSDSFGQSADEKMIGFLAAETEDKMTRDQVIAEKILAQVKRTTDQLLEYFPGDEDVKTYAEHLKLYADNTSEHIIGASLTDMKSGTYEDFDKFKIAKMHQSQPFTASELASDLHERHLKPIDKKTGANILSDFYNLKAKYESHKNFAQLEHILRAPIMEIDSAIVGAAVATNQDTEAREKLLKRMRHNAENRQAKIAGDLSGYFKATTDEAFGRK